MLRVLGFVLETVFFLFIASALLRAYMNWQRISMTAQPGVFVMAMTSWLVKPLRRVMPKGWLASRLDSASVLAAVLLALAYGVLWVLLFGLLMSGGGGWGGAGLAGIVVFAVKMLVRVALQTAMVVAFGYAIISWVQPGSPAYGMLARLIEPLLSPFRRVIPTVGGVDLSVLVLLLVLQIGLMFLG